jgi:membrane fusion protein (multidrug efflux system)
MPAPFTRTLRSIQSDAVRRHTGGLLTAVVLLSAWFAWFLFARVAVYEVTDRARLEVELASHPVAAELGGRVVRTALRLGKDVKTGEILVEVDAQAKRFALDEARARLAGLRAQAQALSLEMRAQKDGVEAHRQESTVALGRRGPGSLGPRHAPVSPRRRSKLARPCAMEMWFQKRILSRRRPRRNPAALP